MEPQPTVLAPPVSQNTEPIIDEQPQKPVEKTPEEVVASYQKRMSAAGKYYEQYFLKRADRTAHMYEVDHYFDNLTGTEPKPDRDRIKVAYPYSNTRQILAEVFGGLPDAIVKIEKKTFVDPQTGQTMDSAPGAQTLKQSIDYVKRKSNMERSVKKAIIDGIATGIGCIQMVAQKDSNIPKFVRKMYREVLWDCTNVLDVYDSDWIAAKLIRPLEEAQDDQLYDETVRQNIPAAKLDEKIYGVSDIQYAVLWEVYDKRKDLYIIYADGQTSPLLMQPMSNFYNLKIEADDFPVDWPFAFFVNEEMITRSWGLGDIFPIESQVRELDKTRTQMVNHRKRFNRKYMMTKGALDAKGINQLKNPDDGTIIELSASQPLSALQPLTDAPMSADVYRVDAAIEEDIQIIGPLGPNSLRSGIGKQPDTLGQAQLIDQSSNTRLGDKQAQIGLFIRRIYKMTAQYIQQYWGEKEEILVTGDGTNDSDWVTYDPQQVQGEYEFDVVQESMKDNSVVYRQQLQQALTTAVPLLRLASASPGVAIMVRKYLQTFSTLKNDIDDIIPISQTQPNTQEAPLTPIPTERISFGVQLNQFPVAIQIKGLAMMGIQATPQDFQTPIPTPATNNVNEQGHGQPTDPVLQAIHGTSPQEFLDTLKKLPDNERQAIEAHVQSLSTPQQQKAQ